MSTVITPKIVQCITNILNLFVEKQVNFQIELHVGESDIFKKAKYVFNSETDIDLFFEPKPACEDIKMCIDEIKSNIK